MWRRAESRRRLAAVAACVLVAGALACDRAAPPDLRRAQTLSLAVQAENGDYLDLSIARDGAWRLPVTGAEISPLYLDLLIRSEDRRFYHHPGVDPLALLRAMAQFVLHGRVVSGGSTLTMQVARLLAPHPHSMAGKVRDIVRALQLEAHYSKAEILSLYLTLAPFGGNIEGVRAASRRYFGHEPSSLSRAEAALLVALPQSPTRRRPDRHFARAMQAADAVLRRAGDATMPELPPVSIRRPERTAPHFAAWLRAQGAKGPVKTTLDAALQRQLDAFARRERPWLGAGAEAAVLVLRNTDGAVRAYLGGTDFFGRAGMVDMVRARRSPGSALKPFIYALAFDDGLIMPDTLIDDAPLRIADYAPQDFDRDFRGTVSAREALQQSYNLPAVSLLDWVGPARFAASLRQAGATLALPAGAEPTLPLALGGVGMNLWDLTMLYAGLGRGGAAIAPRWLASQPAGAARQIVSLPSAEQVLDILRGAPRPVGVAGDSRRIAYKTGTSYGFRDAWAFGVSASYSVGVWVGRPDGTPRPGAFARGTAAPLLFQVFDLLPEESLAPPASSAGESPVLGSSEAASAPRAPALRRLPGRGAPARAADAPRIIYPPAGAILERNGDARLALEAAGGVRPYRWAVNGVPLPAPPAGEAPGWVPDGPGYAHLTLMDAASQMVGEVVRVR